MEVVSSSATPYSFHLLSVSNHRSFFSSVQVLPLSSPRFVTVESRLRDSFTRVRDNVIDRGRNLGDIDGLKRSFLLPPNWSFCPGIYSAFDLISASHGCLNKLKRYAGDLRRITNFSEKFPQRLSIHFGRMVVGLMMVMSVSSALNKSPSLALTEENLLFLEAWRTIDRAYIDKTFNGQSWFRYRENALRNEPMNTREDTYNAIKKMLATLDDPFTRFLDPERFKSLRSGTQGAVTGVGLSIGYSTKGDESAGLVVISAAAGGPANRAGISSGDIILAIDDTSTKVMSIYDAAERLQGPEGSSVQLTVLSGPDIKQLALLREKVSLNPVKSRLCEMPGLGEESPKIGYIKLTTFNQKASGAVKEAIDTLRSSKVSAFVLDLRDNSGGLFPEGVEIAKIWDENVCQDLVGYVDKIKEWNDKTVKEVRETNCMQTELDKGVIVYICDGQGVRDIYDTDGSNVMAATEPLAVLVNKGTASASEILAGALKDNKRAVLYGEPTYGKGKIQSVFELSDGSGLAVTVARYETPGHIDIDKVGVIPDHPLPASFPKDEDSFCSCIKDPSADCYVNRAQLFSR